METQIGVVLLLFLDYCLPKHNLRYVVGGQKTMTHLAWKTTEHVYDIKSNPPI